MLADHPQWSGGAEHLTREFTAKDFPAAITVVDKVAVIAEEMNHHPDIDIRWRTLRFRLSTHSAGGVTDLDLTRGAPDRGGAGRRRRLLRTPAPAERLSGGPTRRARS